jgi:GAF domain-containing protein
MLRKLQKMLTVRETDVPRAERLLPTLLTGSTTAATAMIGAAVVASVFSLFRPAALSHWMLLGMSLLLFPAIYGLRRLSERGLISKTINLLLVVVTLYITLVMPPGSLAAGPALMAYALPVTAAALLLTPGAGLIWAAIATLAILTRTLAVANGSTVTLHPVTLAGGIVSLHLLALLNWLLAHSFDQAQRVLRQQIKQSRTGVEIGHMVTAALDPAAVTQRAVQMIQSAFGYYHVGLFILEPAGDVAVLIDAAGEGASGLKERGFPVALNGTTAVAIAISQKRRRTLHSWRESTDPGGRPVEFTYERLPSRAELVIPLQVGDQVLGALDIHSLELDPFPEEDIHILEGLAGNIANALASARLLEDIQRRHEELATVYAQTERRARYMETTAKLARTISSLLDPQELPDRAVDLISAGLDLYHAGIFLLDETGEWAVLVAASSEGGKRMLARDHKLRVGDQGIVGWVTSTGQPRVALDVGEDAVYFHNPDLLDTRSEIALPLKVGDRVMGALDVQSTQEAAFSEEDATVLQTMADQVVVAIENARLFHATQQALEEVRAMQRQAVAQEWERFTGERGEINAQYRSLGISPLDTAWTHEMEMALTQGAPVVLPDLSAVALDGDGGAGRQGAEGTIPPSPPARSALAVPIRLRGEVIGVLDLQETNEARLWTDEEVTMVTAVTDQLSLALENARLFEEARIRAEELAALNEMGQALTTRLDVGGVLDEAYRGASRLLDTTNFHVALYDPESDSVSFPMAIEDGQAVEWPLRQAEQGLTEYVIRNRQPLLIQGNVAEQQEEMGIRPTGQTALSWLGVPLTVGDRVLGMMAVQSYTTPGAYDEHHQDLLTAIASQTAIALQNAHLYQQAQRRAWRERVAREIGAQVTGSVDLERILQTTARELSQALGASHAVIRLARGGQATGEAESKVE